jgi:hypothetical protein
VASPSVRASTPAWLRGSAGIVLANHTVPYTLIGIVLSVATHIACSAALSTPWNGPCLAPVLGPAPPPGEGGRTSSQAAQHGATARSSLAPARNSLRVGP